MKAVIRFAIALTAVAAFASPAKAQGCDEIPGEPAIMPEICGFVWSDNGDGIQQVSETGLGGLTVSLFVWIPPNGTNAGYWDAQTPTATDDGGFYFFDVDLVLDSGLYKVVVEAPAGTSPSLWGEGTDSSLDNDGVNDAGGAAAFVCLGAAPCLGLPGQVPPAPALPGVTSQELDFGFDSTGQPPRDPGTGTPGYWKNHPEAWASAVGSPYVDVMGDIVSITIGGTTYPQDQAISYMGKVSKHKSVTIFSSLVSAILNVGIGNTSTCIDGSIAAADAWLHAHPVEGPAVAASSSFWQQIEGVHKALDDYNNGRLCAPHRN